MNQVELEEFLQAATKSARALNDLDRAATGAEKAQQKQADRIEKLNSYFQQLGSTVLSAERSTSKYGKSITDVTDATGGLFQQFGVLGFAIGGVVKLLGGLASASLKQNDVLIKTYRSLSEFGNMDFNVDGIEKLKDNLMSLGTNAENAAYFAELIGKVAPDLVAFKGTVTAGKDALIELNKGLLNTNAEDKLKNLGLTTEQITEISGRYVGQLARIGATQGKTTEQLSVKSFNYMVVLQELANLTGQSRDALQNQIDEQNRDVAFRAYLRTIESADERARIQESVLAMSAVNQQWGNLAKETLALGGGIRSAEGALTLMQVPDMYKIMKDSINSKNPAQAVIESLVDREGTIGKQVDQFGRTIMTGGKEAADALGQDSGLFDTLERLKTLKESGNLKDYYAQVKKLMEQTQGRLAQGNKQEQNERRVQNAYQSLIYSIGDLAVPAITQFTNALTIMGLGLAKFVKTMGGGDFTGLFETFDSYKDTVVALNEEEIVQKELKEKSSQIQKSLDEATKNRDERIRKGDDVKSFGSSAAAYQKDIDNYTSQLKDVKDQRNTSRVRQQNAKNAQTQFTGSTSVTTGTKESGLEGLRLKGGPDGAMAEGRTISPQLAKLAQNLARGIPDYTYITSMNDEFHKNMKNKDGSPSKHSLGKALDFTLPRKPTKEEGQAYIQQLKDMGASNVLDEYNNPTTNATAGHMHVEVARKGGLFNGPSSGYPVMLHGKETVLPTKALDNLVSKLPLPGTLFGDNNSNSRSTDDLLNVMNNVHVAIDALSTTFRRALSVQEDILTHTKMLA